MTRDDIIARIQKVEALYHGKHLAQATDDIITRSVHGDLSEAPQQPHLPL